MQTLIHREADWHRIVMTACLAACLAGCGRDTGERNLAEGVKALRAGAYPEAVPLLEEAAQQLPTNGEARCNLGIAQLKAGELEKAEATLKEAADLLPADPEPLEFLATVYVFQGRLKEARASLTLALELVPQSPRILTALGAVEYKAGQIRPATEFLSRALAADPAYAPALYNLARLNLDLAGNRESALKYFEQYLQVAGADEHAAQAREEIARLAGPPAPPAPAVPEPEPARPTAQRVAAAKKAIEKEDYDEALVTLKDTVKRDPGSADALWELAQLYERQLQNREKAAQTLTKFRQLFPADPRGGAAPKRPAVKPAPPAPPAVTLPATNRAPDPRAAQEAFSLGLRRYNARDWDGAIVSYRRALEFAGPSAQGEILYNLGLAFKDKGSLAAARDVFAQAAKADPKLGRASYMLAVVLRDLKQTDEATEELTRLVKAQPGFADAYRLMGLLHLDQGRPDLARKRFEKYLELAPKGTAARQVKDWLEKNR